ncbi:hypothetical protein [Actinomadura livida]|uniref:Integral membrane protein n=1 Tax=Actinomadura livida TaxID=79909 RepID=A0A7W7IHE9_9ACTN|nr:MULTISPECIES: hypothetical protein [Actinomadura]MBB4777144.1 hypothetical protein [Actinomadura catellatispora]GGU21386.1 hypothetical protein GCM10010208_53040 [Actinomadura livida]
MSKRRPITVQAAAALEAAEGLAAIGVGVFTGVETATGAAVDPASAIGVTVLALAGGLGMLACARGLLRAEQWSRAPTVLTQFFALPVAWSLWQSGQLAFAVPLGLAAVLTLITVLSPPSTAWLFDDDEEEAGDREEAARDAAEPAAAETPPGEPRSLGQRLMDRLKEQPTKK